MADYRKILVAIDLNVQHDEQVLAKAKSLAGEYAELFLINAVEGLDGYGASSAFHAITDIKNQITEKHKLQLAEYAKKVGVPEHQIYVIVGSAHTAIVKLSLAIKADLIVIGGYAHHGLSFLLHSTSESLIHHIPCDTLTIKLN